MSLASTRLSLTHLCTVERQATVTADGRGHTAGDWATHLSDVPCRFWTPDGGEVLIEGATIAALATSRLLVALGTDVTEADRITSITYRGGTVQDGPLGVRAVLWRTDHLELVLEKV
jgi:hypothetical protein